jgi:MFS family permease
MSLLLMVSVILLSALGYFFGGPAAMAGAAVFSALAGLGCSIVYPMVVTMLGAIFPRTQSEAVAFAAMGGGIGAFAFPFLMSWIASAYSIRVGFATYALFSVVVVILNIALIRFAKVPKAESLSRESD